MKLISLSPLFGILLFTTRSTIADEVRISNVNDFSSFINNVNTGITYFGTTVILDSDLSLSDISQQIGDYHNYFLGTFDGQGYVITNFALSSSSFSSQYTGLFGYSKGTTIRNVVLDSSCSLTNSYSGPDRVYVGGIIGYCYANKGMCNIENNMNMASVAFSGSISSSTAYIGGIAGKLYSFEYSNYVKNCANYGSVTHSGVDSYSFIGGITGYLEGSQYNHIQNCLNNGKLTHSGVTSTESYIGGIVGRSYYAYTDRSVSAGKITSSNSNTFIGGIVSYADSRSFINNCYYTDSVGVNSVYGNSDYAPSMTSTPTLPMSESSIVSEMNGKILNNDWNKWILNTNSKIITFKSNNNTKGFSISSQIILSPAIITATDQLVFDGWYTDSNHTNIFKSDEILNDMVLYSKYSMVLPIITVTFGVDSGQNDESDEVFTKEVTYNSTYGELPTPKKTGYIFGGWYTSVNGGNLVTSNSTVSVRTNHTLYALWTAQYYTLTLVFKDGATKKYSYKYNETIKNNQEISSVLLGTYKWSAKKSWMGLPDSMPADDITLILSKSSAGTVITIILLVVGGIIGIIMLLIFLGQVELALAIIVILLSPFFLLYGLYKCNYRILRCFYRRCPCCKCECYVYYLYCLVCGCLPCCGCCGRHLSGKDGVDTTIRPKPKKREDGTKPNISKGGNLRVKIIERLEPIIISWITH